MANADDGYRLVLFSAPEDPEAVRDLLVGVAGVHPTDAMRWVARAPGIWPQPLSADQARDLLDSLFKMELPAEARLVGQIPILSPPRTVHKAACRPEGLSASGLRGEPTHWVPWDKVELIAAGRIEGYDEFRDVTPPSWVGAVSTGLNALLRRSQAVARRRRSIRITHEPVGEAILVRRDPRLAIRIVSDKMNYAELGERLKPTSPENFPIFLGDVRTLSGDAYVTESTSALLDGGPPEDYAFDSSHDLMEYATLKLLWSWYRRDRDAGQRTES